MRFCESLLTVELSRKPELTFTCQGTSSINYFEYTTVNDENYASRAYETFDNQCVFNSQNRGGGWVVCLCDVLKKKTQ